MAPIMRHSEETIATLCSLTGLSKKDARHYLNLCKGNVDEAAGRYFDDRAAADDDDDDVLTSYTTGRVTGDWDGWEYLEEEFPDTPSDLIYRGTFDAALEFAKSQNKWLLVNLVNPEVPSCNDLNRKVWADPEVMEMVDSHFVLWQANCKSYGGKMFIQRYKAKVWPYVTVVNPKSEKNSRHCGSNNLRTARLFLQFAGDFLEENEVPEEEVETHPEAEAAAAAVVAALKVSDTSSRKKNKKKSMAASKSSTSTTEKLSGDVQMAECAKEKPTTTTTTTTTTRATAEADNNNNSGSSSGQQKEPSFEDFLGPAADPITKLLLRFPAGDRVVLEWPCSSKLRALFLYVRQQGYQGFEIITNFPRISLDERKMDHATLVEAKFHPQQVLFVNQL